MIYIIKKISKLSLFLVSFFTGCINGLLGSGGGMLVVPYFKKTGMSQREAQANAIAVILPISAVSIISYAISGVFPLSATVPYAVTGIIGGIIGTLLLRKISNKWLSKIFALFMLYAGMRLLFK